MFRIADLGDFWPRNVYERIRLETEPPAPIDQVQLQEQAFLKWKLRLGDSACQVAFVGVTKVGQHPRVPTRLFRILSSRGEAMTTEWPARL